MVNKVPGSEPSLKPLVIHNHQRAFAPTTNAQKASPTIHKNFAVQKPSTCASTGYVIGFDRINSLCTGAPAPTILLISSSNPYLFIVSAPSDLSSCSRPQPRSLIMHGTPDPSIGDRLERLIQHHLPHDRSEGVLIHHNACMLASYNYYSNHV